MTGQPFPPPSAIVQNCYVVPDLEAACQAFHRSYGIGPFVGGTEFTLEEHFYRGRPAPPIRLRGVFGQAGDLNIELLQLISAGPSAFHDMFAGRGTGGFHHVAMFTEDYERMRAHYADAGYPVASEFTIAALSATICYIDTRPLTGHMLELYPENAGIRAMYAQTRTASASWDGQTLIIPWG